MQFWTFILDLVVFLLSLSVLVCLHELGHFSMAKLFKVYCYEFSIGMGPAIYQRKPKKEKNQETIFSVRCLPIGGYVSMAGEDAEEAEGVDPNLVVPKDRTLEGKSRWKQVIIMSAGVLVNFILGYILLVISFSCCTQQVQRTDWTKISIQENSILANDQIAVDAIPENFLKDVNLHIDEKFPDATFSKIENGDQITYLEIIYQHRDANNNVIAGEDGSYYGQSYSNISNYLDYSASGEAQNQSLSYLLSNKFYTSSKEVDFNSEIRPNDARIIIIGFNKSDDINDKSVTYSTCITSKANEEGVFSTIGLSPAYYQFKYSFGESFKIAWDQWCYDCSALFVSVGMLFDPANWSQVGGIISIFKVSSQAVSLGMGSFLNLWALISVNLAVMNLLPFPALDGWQILITILEGIYFNCRNLVLKIKYKYSKVSSEELEKIKLQDESRSLKNNKTYKKIKNIMSLIGMGLLIVLMVVLIVKDIVAPAI